MSDKRPPWQAQRDQTLVSFTKALDQICDSWDGALEAHAARGYPHESPGPRAAAGVVKDTDALHTRQMKPASAKAATGGDATGSAALIEDRAEKWLASARGHLLELLKASGAEATGERRWTGRFHPPTLRRTLHLAAADLVEWWPNNTGHFVNQVVRLGGIAATRWPPTLKPGAEVETETGTVKVGGRAEASEVCTECRTTIAGGADDPLRRIDGKPFHLAPCWEIARARRDRKAHAARRGGDAA